MTTITSTEAGATGRYINLGSPASQDAIGAQTIITRCKPTSVGAGGAGYFLGKTPSGSTAGLRFYYQNGVIGFGSASSGAASSPSTNSVGSAFNYGTEYCFAVTWTGSNTVAGIKLYVNNVDKSSGTGGSGSGAIISDVGNDLFLMNRGDSTALSREVIGDLGYIARWNRVLSTAELTSVYNDGPLTVPSGLILCWANQQDYSVNTITPVARSTFVAGGAMSNTALGGDTYTLSADSSVLTLAGQDAGLTYTAASGATYTLTADGGSLTLAGQYVALTYSVIATPTVTSPNVQAINLQTGQILYEKGTTADGNIPASLTKLMTVYVLLQHRQTLASLQETTIITSNDISVSSYNMLAGDVVSLHELMANALLPSDNSSAEAIGRVIGLELLGGSGTESASKARFYAEMNTQATALGMVETNYTSASGLTGTSSPRDVNKVLAVLATNAIVRNIWRHNVYRMTITRSGTPALHSITASNVLTGKIGIIGGKTGTLTLANLGVLWEAPNGQLIAITTFGAPNDASRYADMTAILSALPVDYPALATPSVPFTPDYLFATLGYGGGWWDGSDTANMWQDAAGTTAVTATAQPVAKWSPKAGDAALYFRQATGANAPLYQGPSTGLQFDGANDYLDLGAQSFGAASLFTDGGQRFMVAQRFSSTGTTGTVLAKAGATSASQTFRSYVDSAVGAEPAVWARGAQTGIDKNIANGAQHTVDFWWDSANGAMSTDQAGSLGLYNGTATEEAQNIILGARTGGTAGFLNGSVQQIVLVDSYDIDAFRRLRDWSNGASVNAFSYSAGAVVSTGYTLVADSDSMTLAGQDAGLIASRRLAADIAAFGLAVQDAILSRGYVMAAASGDFSLVGQDAALIASRCLAAESNALTLTGQDATLTYSGEVAPPVAGAMAGHRVTPDSRRAARIQASGRPAR